MSPCTKAGCLRSTTGAADAILAIDNKAHYFESALNFFEGIAITHQSNKGFADLSCHDVQLWFEVAKTDGLLVVLD